MLVKSPFGISSNFFFQLFENLLFGKGVARKNKIVVSKKIK